MDEPDYLSNLRSAVALSYQDGSAAPAVIAKGRGQIAEEIIRRAKEAGIFVHESRELVSLLMQVDLDQHIPPTLYAAVAELLAWIYKIEQRPAPPRPTSANGAGNTNSS
jgi:flagellar biosynthesis protein